MNREYHYHQAQRHYSAGRYAAAIDALKIALGENPDDADAHALLAATLVSQHRLGAALHEVKLALAIDPMNVMSFWVKARVLIYQNKKTQAEQACEDALRLSPDHLPTLLLLADIYILYGERSKALALLQKASALHPDDEQVLVALAAYYQRARQFNEAETWARAALNVNAENASANIIMGRIRLAENAVAEAEYHAKFVIMHEPESRAALGLLADVKARNNAFIGLWWRINQRMASMNRLHSSMLLVGFFLFFSILAQALKDLGLPALGRAVSYGWLALVVYTWLALPVYYRVLKKELEQFRFRADF